MAIGSYREVHARGHVARLWLRTGAEEALVVPDGCTDVIARADGTLFVAGPDTGPRVSRLAPGDSRLGVRLRPGAAAAALRVPASALRDAQVPLSELWGDEALALEERLAGEPAPGGRLRALHDAVARRLATAHADPLIAAAVARVMRRPATRIATLAAELAISERQLLRRFDEAVGYGPKTLARVLRFQRLLALPREHGLAWAALEAGYADQAHMTAEVRRLAGVTPRRFLRDRAAG